MHWQILYRFSPMKRVITNDKIFMGLLAISYVFKSLYLLQLLHSFSPVQFFNSSLPLPFSHLFPPPPPFLQTLSAIWNLNLWAVTSSAVFCCSAVIITTPNSSIQFFSLFYVLPSAHSTTWMTLMLLMFHILLISLFSLSLNFFILFFAKPSGAC